MAGEVRRRMVDGAIKLLAQRGLQRTSFAEVLELTEAPRGSLYHHFPGGKDELVAAAVGRSAEGALELLDSKAGASAEEIAVYFLDTWRALLTWSDFEAGCALVAVAVATDSPELRTQTARAFGAWRQRLADLLAQGGLSAADAERHASLLLAASEGAVVLSRAAGNLDAFDAVTDLLIEGVRRDLE
jgi:TetR/AcrR family transcriptional regulator, lmrAB and yxaGH operons repressor